MLSENVKNMNPKNIVSGMLGRELRTRTEGSALYASIKRGVYIFSLRHCTINGIKSGGAVVMVTLTRHYDHASGPLPVFVRRLPAGFSDRSLIAAVGRCRNEAMDAAEIMRLRENVYEPAEASGLSGMELCLLEDRYPSATAAYEDMDETECRFWLKEFAGMSASS